MGKILEFSLPQLTSALSTQKEDQASLEGARDLMYQASAILHHGDEVEREVGWLLEDLVDFLHSKGQRGGGNGVRDHYCTGVLAEVVPLEEPN